MMPTMLWVMAPEVVILTTLSDDKKVGILTTVSSLSIMDIPLPLVQEITVPLFASKPLS